MGELLHLHGERGGRDLVQTWELLNEDEDRGQRVVRRVRDGKLAKLAGGRLYTFSGARVVTLLSHVWVEEDQDEELRKVVALQKKIEEEQQEAIRKLVELRELRKWGATEEYKQAVINRRDEWVPANGGHEVAHAGFLYVYNPGTQEHGWLNVSTDIVQQENPYDHD
jgi:hypothetical protein